MELRDYFDAVRKRWLWVLAAVTVAVAAAVLINVRTAPQYATSVTFFVSTSSSQGVTDAYQGGLFSQQRVKSYSGLLTSSRLAETVVDRHSLGLTAGEVQSRVSARPVPDTVLLQATVTDSSPNRSEQIAEAIVAEFVRLVEQLETSPGADQPAIKVEVIAGPLLNPAPVEPQPVRNISLALFLGLLSGVGLALLRGVLDNTVRTVDQMRDVTAAGVLGTIPLDNAARREPLIIGRQAHSPRAEAFRQLRTNLQFADVDKPVHSLVVTSAMPEEGKTTTATNLALSFAEAGSSVLLVEADLRRPQAASYLNMEGAVGLTNVLAGQAELDDVLQPWGASGMTLLPSGFVPPNPSELLGSQQMADLLATLRARFDVVIVDTAPLVPVTDAAPIAAQVDGVIVVGRCAKTSETHLRAAVAALRAVDARLLGCVLNMTPHRGGAYNYYYHEHGRRRRSANAAGPTRQRQAVAEPDTTATAEEQATADVGVPVKTS
ncbi:MULTISPECIES: polysaccharide biosynthesis tyrosine autokinase [unclassified Solwaraspora]|uniref:polysaccharide biosynthesis tyrosine autokinase n=1 Tax=unclassified Solwaraspora TaxID=2627926 RepID=UPI00248AC5E8|nr:MULTISPECIES: polysaccharide biosynthesis tyrosine autokinase [unclassified Solwaraspora]WBB99658.1 polysaccharide biosynthesis tyrosine autokinase [Solwaraspora sp. WMMA2059]WBC21792.1 polysaccharide biosynthesis tyrosine autokinase [Solwaraspora sp. WMMA2080]WJK36161.1 polysaccharide biosynthesis tyrosine autokinase [Solwaraspora sp. WMMA2065]